MTYLLGNVCVEVCPDGKYANEETKQCTNCRTGCKTCSSESVCNECDSGFVMLGTICSSISCKAPCEKCGISNTECISCADPLFLIESSKICVTKD